SSRSRCSRGKKKSRLSPQSRGGGDAPGFKQPGTPTAGETPPLRLGGAGVQPPPTPPRVGQSMISKPSISFSSQSCEAELGRTPHLWSQKLRMSQVGHSSGAAPTQPPPILWAAMRYGRELRRMSDEFDVALQVLPRPRSAGTASQLHRGSSWKETIQAWLGHKPARDVPRKAPSDCSPPAVEMGPAP
uniref:Uncharacterized protein n=1 Tax=Pelusios castaneus TaxID=367368 RepID=A0A8C8R9Q6_9SAUR